MATITCTESILRRIGDRVSQHTWAALSASMKAKDIESAIYGELEVRHPDDTVSMGELARLRIRACCRLMSERDLAEIGLNSKMGDY